MQSPAQVASIVAWTIPLLVSAQSESDAASQPRLRPRFDAQNESDYWEGDAPPAFDNSTFDLYAWSRGLEGVDQTGNYLWMHVLLGSFVALCAATFALRLARAGQAYLRHTTCIGGAPNQNFWRLNRSAWWTWIKKDLEYAPLWKARHNREIQLSSAVSIGTLPSRFHTLLLVSFLICNIAYMLVLPWHISQSHSVVAALRGRAGMLAMYNMIIGTLFALRNNPLIPILQVSYDTFNLLHRWCMRLFTMLTVVHALCWFDNTYAAGQWKAVKWSLATVSSYQWGFTATIIFIVMIAVAWSPIRHAWYETFINFHRLFAVLGFVGVYRHLLDHNLPQLPWMQAVFILWALEYVARIFSITWYNVGRHGVTTVTVEALPSEACRVTFNLVRPWRPRAGCHAHFYLPSIGYWSSHPFSVAWADTVASRPTDPEKLQPTVHEDPTAHATSVSMVIRARSGFTRTLYNKASAQKDNVYTATGLIEGLGTYGAPRSLRSYGTVVLFAGGVGITHQTMYVRDLVSGFCAGTAATRKVVLCWSIPNSESLSWVQPWMDQILKMPGRKECLQIKLFVTKPRRHGDLISGSGTVQMFPGRCNPLTVLQAETKDQVGAMAVTVCGPGAFADSVRQAARSVVENTVVDFIEEAFTY